MPKISESPIARTKISIPSAMPLRIVEKFWSKKFAARRNPTDADPDSWSWWIAVPLQS
jgi:hypothetical protein